MHSSSVETSVSRKSCRLTNARLWDNIMMKLQSGPVTGLESGLLP